jgi:hypothetical protein
MRDGGFVGANFEVAPLHAIEAKDSTKCNPFFTVCLVFFAFVFVSDDQCYLLLRRSS